jgi:hypothetical protein
LANGLFTIARKVRDRAGLVLFSESVEFYKAPCTDLCVPNLGSRKFGIKSDPRMVAGFLQSMLKVSSVIFFVSDFLYPNKIRDNLMEALKTLSKRHDLVCVQLLDQIDVTIPSIGKLRLQDSESLECALCNSSDMKFSSIYGNIDTKWTSKLRRDAKKVGLKFVAIRNGCSVESAIKKCLDKRLADV